MNKYIMITTACLSKENANLISETLLEKHLISCAQISTIESAYHWQGKIEHHTEYLIQMKTVKYNYDEIEKEIKNIHTYEVPEIAAYDIILGEETFLKWISEETNQSTSI